MKIVHRAQPTWGVGEVLGLREQGRFLEVRFSGRGRDPILVSAKDPALARHRFQPGDEVSLALGGSGVVREALPTTGPALFQYQVELQGQVQAELRTCSELELVPKPPKAGALELLSRGRGGEPSAFALRQQAVRLDLERRADALGALFGSRVMPKPHQLSVVHRVLAARQPRFVLADEVGLGKTIEAGMVYAALRQAGLARRVLVVAPSHLTVQWLGELFHKFHSLFTLVDEERVRKEEDGDDPRPIWWRHDRIVTSLELLAGSEEHQEAIAAEEAEWDLVIFDEAHHLAHDDSYAAAEALADNTHGLLLLTATPLQLDPVEHFKLQLLVDPAAPESFEAFEQRLERQGEISDATRRLLSATSGETAAAAAADILALLPRDPKLVDAAARIAAPGDDGRRAREAFVGHLAETYSISSRLIRNRRAIVGGLSARKLVRHDVTPAPEELALVQRVREAVVEGTLKATPFALVQLYRRLGSSPRAAAAALVSAKLPELAAVARQLESAPLDRKTAALLELVAKVRAAEPGAKLLVFSETRESLEYLRERLGRAGVAAGLYHGDLTQLDRDRAVARFRDPDGPEVLLSTEVGGEGRNFQFCHHLVHYDLAWSPAAIEQRIGRIDRIGQRHEVMVHAFRVAGTMGAHVYDLFADAVRVFEETVGGLDPVLEIVENDLGRLALQGDPAAFARYGNLLATRVAEAREEIKRAYDPLLDLRSFDGPAVAKLLDRACARLELETSEDDSLEVRLDGIARELDERLEETVIALARRVGIQVDTDEQVDAFQCLFKVGGETEADALPGLALDDGERQWLGSFWRDTAVVQEEHDYFATGHPLVEALFGHCRDGELGRATWIETELLKSASLGFAFHFLVGMPEAEDLAAGAKIPSRQAARQLAFHRIDVGVEWTRGSVRPHVRDELLQALQDEQPEPARAPGAGSAELAAAVEAAWGLARAEAHRRLARELAAADQRMIAERDTAVERLALASERAEPDERRLLALEAQKLEEWHSVCVGALRQATLELDQAAGLVPA